MEHPGRRVAAAEAALARFIRYCSATADGQCRLAGAASRSRRSRLRTNLREPWTNASSAPAASASSAARTDGCSASSWTTWPPTLASAWSRTSAPRSSNSWPPWTASCTSACATCRSAASACATCKSALETGASNDEADTTLGLEVSPNSPVPSTESFWEAIRQSATTRVVLPGRRNRPGAGGQPVPGQPRRDPVGRPRPGPPGRRAWTARRPAPGLHEQCRPDPERGGPAAGTGGGVPGQPPARDRRGGRGTRPGAGERRRPGGPGRDLLHAGGTAGAFAYGRWPGQLPADPGR